MYLLKKIIGNTLNIYLFNNYIVYSSFLTISRGRKGRMRCEYRLLITEPEATNCFSTYFQVFTNNYQLNLQTITSNSSLYKKAKIKKL